MSMTLAEGRAECKRLFDECESILARFGGTISDAMPTDERKKIDDNLAEINGLEIKMGGWKRDDEAAQKIASGVVAYGAPAESHHQPGTPTDERKGGRRSLGAEFVGDDRYRELVKRGAWSDPTPRVAHTLVLPEERSLIREIKALVTAGSDTSGGAFIVADRQPGFLAQLYPSLSFLDLLPVVPTSSDLVEWVAETAFTNNAAPVLEATATTGTSGLKPESAAAFQVLSQAVQSIAHWIPLTTRAMQDAPQLRGIIEGELLAGLQRVLEAQCVTGNGTAPNLAGLMPQVTQTTASTAPHAEAFFVAQMLVRTAGLVAPNANVMDAAAWSAIRLARENAATGTLGNYLLGGPGDVAAPTLWGLPVVLAEAMPANTGVVGDFTAQSIVLYERLGGAISTGWINDQFIRNIVTILAELRAALAVKRPLSFCKVTGLP